MLYISTISLVVLNLFFNLKNKKSSILFGINFIFFVILLGFTYGPYDTQIFIERYVNYQRFESFTEGLFNVIVKIFNNLGINYRNFMIIISLIELYFIFRFIKKHTNNPFFVLALFMIYPMIVWFTQLRTLMAFTIVLAGGIDSLIEKNKNYRIRAIIFIIIASFIHSSSVFYLLFVFIDKFSNKKMILFILAMSLCISFIEPLIEIATLIVGETKINAIIAERNRSTGLFGRCMTALTMIVGYFLMYLLIKSDKNYCQKNKENIEFMDTIAKYNFCSLTCIPLIYVFSTAFYRIPQSLLLLNYIAISKYLITNEEFKIRRKEFYIYVLSIIYAIVLFFMMFHTEEIYKLVVTPFFEQNVVASFFRL